MITNINVPLETNEYRTLAESAEEDIRSISEQARLCYALDIKSSLPVTILTRRITYPMFMPYGKRW